MAPKQPRPDRFRRNERGPQGERQEKIVQPPRGGRITAISAQRHDPERMSVFLDGEFAFGVHADLVLEHGLYPDLVLEEATVREILADDEVRRAIATALNALAYRARSEGEIAQRLRQKGFPQPAIDATLERLRGWQYVDDADFASRWIENRQEHRPRSERMLAQELRQKGVDVGTIAESIAGAGIDEVGDAKELAAKQRAKLAPLDPETRTRRITGFLSRRGYSWEVIRQALADDIPEDEE